jgi:hypothetical protein
MIALQSTRTYSYLTGSFLNDITSRTTFRPFHMIAGSTAIVAAVCHAIYLNVLYSLYAQDRNDVLRVANMFSHLISTLHNGR